jgi:hypothetical protein
MDFSSLLMLLDRKVLEFLDGTSPVYRSYCQLWSKMHAKGGPSLAASAVLGSVRNNDSIAAALSIIDRFVCHEYIVIDAVTLNDEFHHRGVLLEDIQRLQVKTPFLFPVSGPTDVYATAAEMVQKRRSIIDQINNKLDYTDFDAADKNFHDLLFRMNTARRYSFADSGDVAERAVFYGLVASVPSLK